MSGLSTTASRRRPAIGLILVLLASLAAGGCGRHPSDEEILAHFAEHRPGLEKIVSLLTEDPELTPLWREPTEDHAVGPLADRVRAEMAKTDVVSVLRDVDSGGLLFTLHEVGIAISGASKGLLYVEGLPPGYYGEVVADIDQAFADARARQKEHEGLDVIMVRPIDGSWFVHFATY